MRNIYPDARAVAEALTPSYPVYCLDLAGLAAHARAFVDAFPGRVLYAVKCNPYRKIIDTLYEAGVRHFDTASLPEIAQVRESHRDAGAYFMNPAKARAVIRTAYEVYGVRHFVVDHLSELEKTLEATGGEGIVVHVRLKTGETKVLFDLASKFGAPLEEAVELLAAVHSEGLRSGLAFHVGSQCQSVQAYRDALRLCAEVVRESGVNIDYLDIGGGFPAYYPGQSIEPLAAYFSAITQELATMRLRNDTVLMCEPGRALVADYQSLLTQVLLRKEDAIYINDGIYGSLSELVLTRLELPMRVIRLDGPVSEQTRRFTVYGPTCDSMDILPNKCELPDDIREGDWIEIGQLGAYSNAGATRFNGFSAETYVEVESVFR
ncbi:MAG: type III PLP-dependent enzyme [Gammaproteobacteria bacterium]|nr:type III PLP-dependent enzyme [Gammaproteobacteria bacterium]